jgi:hypothetical protein
MIVLAIALTDAERDLLLRALEVAVKRGAVDAERARPLIEMLEGALSEKAARLALGALR